MILVTGGTGFVGREIVRRLLADSRKVRCLARRPDLASGLAAEGCQMSAGDVTSRSSVLKAITPDIEAVIHLVGILAEKRGATFRNVHVEGTRNVVDACKGMGVSRYIHMSALGAREGAEAEYYRTKWEAEEIVRGSGLEYTIFRPSVIFGKEDRFTNVFASMMRMSPFVLVPGGGKGLMQPVYVKDVAQAFAESLKMAAAIGRTFEAGGPEVLSFDQVLDKIAQALGKRRRKVHVPMPVMSAAAYAAGLVFSKPPFSRDSLLMLKEDNTASMNSLVEVFHMRPVSLSEGMASYLN